MLLKKYAFICFLFLLMVVCHRSLGMKRQRDKNDRIPNNTSFQLNTTQGWVLYGSYWQMQSGRVVFELILNREMRMEINWNFPVFGGTIDHPFFPNTERRIVYNEPAEPGKSL